MSVLNSRPSSLQLPLITIALKELSFICCRIRAQAKQVFSSTPDVEVSFACVRLQLAATAGGNAHADKLDWVSCITPLHGTTTLYVSAVLSTTTYLLVGS